MSCVVIKTTSCAGIYLAIGLRPIATRVSVVSPDVICRQGYSIRSSLPERVSGANPARMPTANRHSSSAVERRDAGETRKGFPTLRMSRVVIKTTSCAGIYLAIGLRPIATRVSLVSPDVICRQGYSIRSSLPERVSGANPARMPTANRHSSSAVERRDAGETRKGFPTLRMSRVVIKTTSCAGIYLAIGLRPIATRVSLVSPDVICRQGYSIRSSLPERVSGANPARMPTANRHSSSAVERRDAGETRKGFPTLRMSCVVIEATSCAGIYLAIGLRPIATRVSVVSPDVICRQGYSIRSSLPEGVSGANPARMPTANRHSPSAVERRDVGETRKGFPYERLSLDGAARNPANEVALQEDEHRQRERHLQHRGRGQELPAASERRHQPRDHNGERPVRADAQEGQGDEQVVPDPQEDEDRERGDGGDRHGHGDAQEPRRVAGAVDLGGLEDLARQAAQVVPQQEDLERQAVARVRKPHGHDRAVDVQELEDLEDRDQRHLDRHHHQADDDDEEEVPAREPHPGERVRAHGRDRQLDDGGRDRDQDAVEDRRRDAFDREDLPVALQGEPVRRQQRGPPA